VYEELLAEKTRALYERTRPRDLYDVVFMLDNSAESFDLAIVQETFVEKCESKGFRPPSASQLGGLVAESDELTTDWEQMLAHQLPELPPLEGFTGRLDGLLEWIDGVPVIPSAELEPISKSAAETLYAPIGAEFTGGTSVRHLARFAGANRLLVEFDYHDRHRLVEPYSFRTPATGNLLLYAWEVESGQIKAFNVDKITNLTVSKNNFVPRYRVEFTGGGPVTTAP